MSEAAEIWRDTRKNVEINVGKICNNKCSFCLDGLPATELRRYMPYPEMQAEIQRWYDEGQRSVGFLGGEPTTYPWIVDAIRFARDLGYTRIALATNGTKFFRHEFVDKLLDAGLTRVTVSMHGHNPRVEDLITGVPGNFLKKKSGLQHLLRRRAEGALRDNVSTNIVVGEQNYRFLPNILRFFFELGIDDVRANFVRSEGYAETDTSLIPRFTDVVPYVVKAVLLNEYHYKRTFTIGSFPLCVLPPELLSPRLARKYIGEFRDLDTWSSIKSADGEAFTDGVSVVEGGRARFNWQERKREDLKTHPPERCGGCRYFDVCEGVWRKYLPIHGDSELRAIKA